MRGKRAKQLRNNAVIQAVMKDYPPQDPLYVKITKPVLGRDNITGEIIRLESVTYVKKDSGDSAKGIYKKLKKAVKSGAY